MVMHNSTSPLAKLRDFRWWPNVWRESTTGSVTLVENEAVLTNVKLADNHLTLISQRNGATFTAKVDTSLLPQDCLVLLRHILLQHWGEPLSAVEALEVDLGAFEL